MFTASKHELQPFDMEDDCDMLPQMNWDQPIVIMDGDHDANMDPMSDVLTDEQVEMPCNVPSRHAILSDSDIDEVAKQRLAQNTSYQTRWAVRLFRGEYCYCHVIYLCKCYNGKCTIVYIFLQDGSFCLVLLIIVFRLPNELRK